MLHDVEHPNVTDMRSMWNIDLLCGPSPLSRAVSPPLFTVLLPSATAVLDNKESNLPSAHWRRHIAPVLTEKCGARATEQCNWRGTGLESDCSRSGSRLGYGRTLLTDRRRGTCDLVIFFLLPFSLIFLPLSKVYVAAFTSLSRLLLVLLCQPCD